MDKATDAKAQDKQAENPLTGINQRFPAAV